MQQKTARTKHLEHLPCGTKSSNTNCLEEVAYVPEFDRYVYRRRTKHVMHYKGVRDPPYCNDLRCFFFRFTCNGTGSNPSWPLFFFFFLFLFLFSFAVISRLVSIDLHANSDRPTH